MSLASLVLLLALWEAVRLVFGTPEYVLPPVMDVGRAIVDDRTLLWDHGLVTLTETLLGFTLALVVGTIFAIVIAFSRPLERLLYPPLVVTQAVPKVALAPLFLVWFGFGMTSKVAIAALIAVFPVVIDTVVGLRSIDPEMVRMAKSMRGNQLRVFWRLRLPTAMPSVLAGMKMAMTFAVTGAVVGEFVSGSEGLGYLVQTASGLQQTEVAYGAIIVLSAIGVALFAVISVIERRVLAWHPSVQEF
jgi:NitT/TauT family transport system permease protein